MKKFILSSALACAAAITFSASAMADEVIVTQQPTYEPQQVIQVQKEHPAVVVEDNGAQVGTVRDHSHCDTKTVKKENDEGDQVTKTTQHCD